MSISKKDAERRIEAQRESIREHIEKYETYPHDRDKRVALDTISRCQERIIHIKDKATSNISYSWEDDWED